MARLREEKGSQLRWKINADITAGTLPEATDANVLSAFVMATLAGLVQRPRDGATGQKLDAVAILAVTGLP